MQKTHQVLFTAHVVTVILSWTACTGQQPAEPPSAEPPKTVATKPSPPRKASLPTVGWIEPAPVEARDRAPAPKQRCVDARYQDAYTPGYTPDPAVMNNVAQILATLSLEEKADQMRGTPHGPQEDRNWKDIFRSLDNADKNLRGFRFRDGPRGLNLDASCPEGNTCYSTAFPVEMARGAAFDPALERRIGRAAGDETLAAGHNFMLAPNINIVRHPAWGRTQESYGEDPYLLGRLASAYIVGVQEYVPACSKHYIANNIEKQRRESNAVLDEQTLREVYGRAYEMTIRDAGVACIMASYNKVNGIRAGLNRHVLTDILRDDFGFRGMVVSDWWGLGNEFDVNLDKEKYETVAREGVEAGCDMEMPWSLNFEHLESLVKKGELTEAQIDTGAARILEQKLRFRIGDLRGEAGLKRPATKLDDKGNIVGNEKHLDLAYEAAVESAVLLKNDNGTLPIDKAKVKTVAVLGKVVPYEQRKYASKPSGRIDFARDVTVGDLGSSRINVDPEKSIGPFDGIRMAAGETVKVVAGDTVKAAKDADFVVVVAGLTPGDEGEEYTGAEDRKSFALDDKIKGTPQNDLIRAAAELGKPMAVVLVGGSVIDMPWLEEVPAVVMSWYPGIHGGRALGDLLFGNRNFSGKLPLTWPNSWEELPELDPGAPNEVKMDYYLGYRYYDHKGLVPLFPFGHGLSYAKFAYNNLEVPCATVTKNGVVEVKVDVINQGNRPGEEIVFLYVSYPETQTRRPVKELKGFMRVSLDPGQAKQVTIPLRISDLKYWNTQNGAWEVESGKVKIMVGGNPAELELVDFVVVE